MEFNTNAKNKEAFVQAVQERVGQLAAELYERMAQASRTLGEMEEAVTQAMWQVGRELLQTLCEQEVPRYPEGQIRCECGETAEYVRMRTGQMKTQLGVLRLRRPYYLCESCGQGCYPMDEALGFCAGSISAGLEELLAYVGSQLAFEEAAGLLEQLRGLSVSSGRIRRATEELGKRVQAEEAHAVEEAWEQGETPPVTAPLPPSQPFYISMDGVSVLIRKQGGREQKLGAVYTTRAKPARQRPDELEIRAEEMSFYTEMADAETFGRGLWLEAQRRGLAQAEQVVVIGDGAHWIWRLADEHFPGAIQILDWYHASSYIWKAAQAIYGPESDLGKRWARQRLDQLWEGKLDPLRKELQKYATHQAVQEAMAYYQNNRTRMDYPRYRQMGLQIGSGVIESGCKHVIAHRLRQAGMRWTEEGAQAVAKLRARLKSGRWQETAALIPPPKRSYHRSAA
ncbi:MAG: hypothetical protein KatS3mg050_0986 [Litorilinea sp.]|nr:MAG: hypothetical protein KatS3mg050_0986 [Litorilinea sp.]